MSESTSLQDQFNNPLVRDYELDENSTHYDKLIAAPSDDDLFQMWTAWSIALYTFAIFTTTVLVALVCTPSVRQRPFNLFLMYLMIPDTLAMWFCGSSCLVNAVTGYFTSVGHCRFQSFYITAAIGANAWLNAAITRHLLAMLRSAKHFQKYKPPTRRRVTLESLLVYCYAMFLASWFLFDADWWPFKTRLSTGVVCIPQDYDTKSTIFLYTIFLPLWFVIPLLYVCYAAVVIYRQNLMPKTGRRRVLAIYFFRLVLAFLIMWIPCLLLLFVTSPWTNPWVQWAGGFWGHLQGAVSGVMSLMKPDIWDAFVEFYKPLFCCCNCCNTGVVMNESMEERAERRGYWDKDSYNSTAFSTPFLASSITRGMSVLGSMVGASRFKRDLDAEINQLKRDLATFASSAEGQAASSDFAYDSETESVSPNHQQEMPRLEEGEEQGDSDEESPNLVTSQTTKCNEIYEEEGEEDVKGERTEAPANEGDPTLERQQRRNHDGEWDCEKLPTEDSIRLCGDTCNRISDKSTAFEHQAEEATEEETSTADAADLFIDEMDSAMSSNQSLDVDHDSDFEV